MAEKGVARWSALFQLVQTRHFAALRRMGGGVSVAASAPGGVGTAQASARAVPVGVGAPPRWYQMSTSQRCKW